MLSVRELKGLARRLDEKAFARQLGPFVLVQRPIDERPTEPSVGRPRVTQPVPVKALKPSGVLAFEELWVATLPPLAETDSFVLGRSPDCDLVIDEETVSSHHARIEWMVEHAELEDLGSSNGTFVNGVKVSGHTRLVDSDAIDFGGVRVFFFSVATLRERMNERPSASR